MKLLMLTPYLPYPPSSGGQVRSYNLIKHLSHRHKIYLVSLVKSEEEKKYVQALKPYCEELHICKRSESPWTLQNIARSLLGRFPFLVVRNYSSETHKTISSILSRVDIDLIHAETFYIMPQIPETKVPILLVEQTIEFMVYEHFVRNLRPALIKPAFYYDVLKLKFWEEHYWKKASLVGAMSESDRKKMRKLIPNLQVEIIPNAAGEDLSNLYDKTFKKPEPIFMYQGNFSWLQNVEAAQILAREIFPYIKKSIPDARCLIAGQKAAERLENLTDTGVEIIDIQSSDIKGVMDIYKRASIFLAPIEGPGGTRLKILGAMAAGIPVIASETGLRGLDVVDGEQVLIARTREEFAKLAQSILKDHKKYNAIRSSARALVDKKYSWDTVASHLEKVYKKLIARPV